MTTATTDPDPDPDPRTIILEYVCPALGCLMANLMFSAPYRDLRRAVQRGQLGDLNPTPWAFMLGNCFGWVTYGILIRNFWIYFANAPGFLLSIWLNLGAAKLLYQGHHSNQMRTSFANYLETTTSSRNLQPISTKSSPSSPTTTTTTVLSDWAKIVWDVTSQTTPAPVRHESLVLVISSIWMALVTFLAYGETGVAASTKELVVGVVVNLNLIFFYGAPLSTIWTVLTTRSSASIHVPTMITNTPERGILDGLRIGRSGLFYLRTERVGGPVGGRSNRLVCAIFSENNSNKYNNNNKHNNKHNNNKHNNKHTPGYYYYYK
jgi:solute carrier family 50 protein (sugar transporter)